MSFGVHYNSKTQSCEAKLWVPHANAVYLEILSLDSATPRRVELNKSGSGDVWERECSGLALGDEYRVIIDSNHNDCFNKEGKELKRRDPWTRFCSSKRWEDSWCVLTDRGESFHWNHDRINLPSLEGHSVYELHIGSFTAEGTFLAAAEKVRHVADLGFTVIELMPVTEFGGLWGYNPRQLLSVHSPYGTPDDLRLFIDRCHSLGVAVVIDIVLNHGSSKLNSLWNWDGYGPHNCGGIFFDKGGEDTPWGRKFAFERPEVVQYLYDASEMWYTEFNADGLRFDSVHNMPVKVLQRLTYDLRRNFPNRSLIAEVVPELPEAIGSWGFDALWAHAPHFDVSDLHAGRAGDWFPKVKAMAVLRHFSGASSQCVNAQLGSHDQIGCRKNGGRDDEGRLHRYFVDRVGGRENWHGRAITRMWWAACAVGFRNVPMLFMGSETLQGGWWHVDQKMQDLRDAPAEGMMKMVKDCNELRQTRGELCGGRVDVVHEDGHNMVLGLRKGKYAVLVHFGEAQWDEPSYGFSVGGGGRAEQIFNSQAEEYGGWEGSWNRGGVDCKDGKIFIKIPKWSVAVFEIL